MTHHRWLGACVLGACLVAAVRADGPPRHVPLPPSTGTAEPDAAFNSQLQNWKLGKLTDQAAGLTEAQKQQIRDYVLKNRDKVGDLSNVPDLIKGYLNRDLTPGEKDLIQAMVKNLGGDPAKGGGPVPPKGGDPAPPTPPDKGPPTGPANPPPTPANPNPTPAAGPTEEEQREQEEFARQLAEIAKRFEGFAQSLPDSPAMQGLLQDLAKFQANLNSPGGPGGAKDDLSLAKMAKSIRDINKWLKVDESTLSHITPPKLGPLPSLPNTQFPQILPGFSPTAPPGLGALPGPRALAIFAGVVSVGLLLLWKLRDWLPRPDDEPTGTVWRLGAWPVEPSKIASRAELIRAFDYLTLRRFGQAALSWNHRAVAARLGDGDEERTRAADRLAAAYEQARYAPGTGPLDETALAEARADLCFLAGAVAG